jgi:hypothetical protein
MSDVVLSELVIFIKGKGKGGEFSGEASLSFYALSQNLHSNLGSK